MRVKGTPKHSLSTDRADVNLHMGRNILWFEGGLGWEKGYKEGMPNGIALACEGDMNRNTGCAWTKEELINVANRINQRIQPWWRRWLP